MCRRLVARAVAALVACALALVLADGIDPASAAGAGKTISVRSDAGFAKAVKRLKRSGGTIRLLPHRYRRLVVGPRSWRPLRIVGTRGARVGARPCSTGTQRVSFGRVTVAPVAGDARHRGVAVAPRRRSTTSSSPPAGTRALRVDPRARLARRHHQPEHVHPLRRPRPASSRTASRSTAGRIDVVIEDNRFHDCLGCDFVNGRFGSDI